MEATICNLQDGLTNDDNHRLMILSHAAGGLVVGCIEFVRVRILHSGPVMTEVGSRSHSIKV
ncbi:hypothetical protein DY000_02025429 [Brassica cretica]|uniref:Uncharacterized protein n=1 Tax=Brassica cretica TaxID=69181 RepID=A0ABQ7E9Z2_BRACR|nr:hypothetical protein DY000_02025429 [Brassica cretica]